MRPIFMLFLLLTLALPAFAQGLTEAEQSDPEARKVLDAMRNKYENYPGLSAEFELVIKGPEQPEEVQQGKLLRQGEKYKLDLGSQTVLSTGEALYLILHQNQEIQINDLPDEEAQEEVNILSPQSLFTFYESGQFVYLLTNELARGNQVIQQIEFKPVDRNAEYYKLRLELVKSSREPVQVEAFARDGSRYTIRFRSLEKRTDLPAAAFAFSRADYPDYYVEDLRQ